MTEREVLDSLQRHFLGFKSGNGDSNARRYTFTRHVRSQSGHYARNEFDAVVVDTWTSKGLLIQVIEVKVSRSDWLSELKNPEKTQASINAGDLFSVAAPPGVIKLEELREGWGWYEIKHGKVFCKRAPKQHTQQDGHKFTPLGRSFAIALLRATQKQYLDIEDKQQLQIEQENTEPIPQEDTVRWDVRMAEAAREALLKRQSNFRGKQQLQTKQEST